MQPLREFARETSKLAYKWINRRSQQKKSCIYAQYWKFKEYNPLAEPKIYLLIYILFSYRGSITEEPILGNLNVRFCEGYYVTQRRL